MKLWYLSLIFTSRTSISWVLALIMSMFYGLDFEDYHVVYVFIWASGLVAMIPLLLHSLPNTLWQVTFFLGPWIIMSQLGRSLEGVLIASHLTLIFTFVLGIWMIIEILISSGQGIPKMCNSFALLWHNI